MNNIDKYLSREERYYKPQTLLNLLDRLTDKTIEELMSDLNKSITVTEEEIRAFLDERFTQENKSVKDRMSSKQRNKNLSQVFKDYVISQEYHYEPYTLQYYIKYTNILRTKISTLLNIIYNISIKNIKPIIDTLIDLDINLDELGNISEYDLKRLIIPTVYNINDFNKMIEEGNKLSTYLTNKISKDYLGKEDILESKIYPTKELQIRNLYCDYLEGNIPLSEKQKEVLRKQDVEIFKKILKRASEI